jgi:putative DNA primase/helicase
LGDEWYASVGLAFGDKEFLQTIQGKWLIEIPDMTGFSRREHSQVIATITTRSDCYRASYGRFAEDHPRRCVFAATSETDDYLADARGRRRYWPLRCQAIDIDALQAQREQIFAEALRAYMQGSKWHLMPDRATDEEQLARASPDIWSERVLDYVDAMGDHEITSSKILKDAIEMPLAKQTLIEKNRISRIMRENGYIQLRTKDRRYWKKVQRP